MALGHLAIFACGFAWLRRPHRPGEGVGRRRRSFRAATVVKTLLACALVAAAWRARRDASRRRERLSRWRPTRTARPRRAARAFARFVPMSTRWTDNDPYGHINNVAYYALFDAAVNAILIEAGLLDPASSTVIGLVVENNCRFYSSLAFPEPIEVGVAVEHLGRTSVRYHLAAFKAGAPQAAAAGRYTHVYVERATQSSDPRSPTAHRRLMEKLKPP